MKKGYAVLSIFVMVAAAILPVISADVGDQATGRINYQTGQGNDPAKILAIWEFVTHTEPEEPLDDDLLKPGLQKNPPVNFGEYVNVYLFVAFYDPDNDIPITSNIKFRTSWPNNSLRPALGLGGMKQNNNTSIHPVNWGNLADLTAADEIDNGPNYPFVCYYNEAKDGQELEEYDYIYDLDMNTGHVKYAWAMDTLYYHDPAGWYDCTVRLQGTSTDETEVNYFEYVLMNGIEFDFDVVDWGIEQQLEWWHEKPGDRTWDTSDFPTVRNIGNWDVELWANFSLGDFAPGNVQYNVRMGDQNPSSTHYNQSYLERYGGPILPGGDYGPLPICNFNELGTNSYNETLLKCHMAKIIFYLWVWQFEFGTGIYEFDIEMFPTTPSWTPFDPTYYPYPSP
jgi:hypothetical protein